MRNTLRRYTDSRLGAFVDGREGCDGRGSTGGSWLLLYKVLVPYIQEDEFKLG